MLRRYGWVPQHLGTTAAYLQAMDLIGELATVAKRRTYAHQVANGVAWAIAKAVKKRKAIHSLGFIAEPLLRMASAGDERWLWEVMSIEDPAGARHGHGPRAPIHRPGQQAGH